MIDSKVKVEIEEGEDEVNKHIKWVDATNMRYITKGVALHGQ